MIKISAEAVMRLDARQAGRRFRVVHALDGIRNSVENTDLEAVGNALWSKWSAIQRPKASLLVGMDAGGLITCMAIGQVCHLPMRFAWKFDLDIAGKLRFTEPFANRRDITCYGLKAGDKVLIVDDEITSGATLLSFIEACLERGVEVIGALALVNVGGEGVHALEKRGIPVCTLTTIPLPRDG